MARPVEHAANSGDIAGYTGCRFIVSEENRVDALPLVGLERFLITLVRGSFAAGGINDLHVQSEALCHIDPQMAEHSESCGENPVPGRESIG